MDRWPNGEPINRSSGEWGLVRSIGGLLHYVLRDAKGNVRVYPIVGGTVGLMVLSLVVHS